MSKKRGRQYDPTSLINLESFSKDELTLFKKFLGFLKQERGQKDTIPISIFNTELSTFESIVKYLREEKEYSYKKISEILKRKTGPIGVTYRNAKKKFSAKLDVSDTSIVIPFSIFKQKLTILEAVVLHLKESDLTFGKIAKLLKRDYRTIWTVYSRARRKNVR